MFAEPCWECDEMQLAFAGGYYKHDRRVCPRGDRQFEHLMARLDDDFDTPAFLSEVNPTAVRERSPRTNVPAVSWGQDHHGVPSDGPVGGQAGQQGRRDSVSPSRGRHGDAGRQDLGHSVNSVDRGGGQQRRRQPAPVPFAGWGDQGRGYKRGHGDRDNDGPSRHRNQHFEDRRNDRGNK
jgi:hypothetical protein